MQMQLIGYAEQRSLVFGHEDHQPRPYWAWQGRVARVEREPVLRMVGRGLAIRLTTGEVFEEPEGPKSEALYA